MFATIEQYQAALAKAPDQEQFIQQYGDGSNLPTEAEQAVTRVETPEEAAQPMIPVTESSPIPDFIPQESEPATQEEIDQYRQYVKEEKDAIFQGELDRIAEEKRLERQIVDEEGNALIDPGTGLPLERELTNLESMKNSLDGMGLTIQEFFPNLKISSGVIARKLFGDEAIDEFVESGDGSAWDNFWREGLSDEDIAEAEQEKEILNAKRGETKGIIDSFQKGDVGGVAAGVVNAVTSLGSSMAINYATGGAGLFTDFFGRSYTDYNAEKAKREGKSVEELRANDEDSFWVPFAFAGLMGASEKFGLGKIDDAAREMIKKPVAKKAAAMMIAGTSEGGTEMIQTMLEKSQQKHAETNDAGAAGMKFFEALGEQDTWEAAIQGFVGGAGVSRGRAGASAVNLQKAAAVMRDPSTAKAIDDKVAKITDLKQKIAATDDKQVKNLLKGQVTDIKKSLRRDVEEGNKIIRQMTDEQVDEAATINDKLNKLREERNTLDKKVAAGELDMDAYLDAAEAIQTKVDTFGEQLSKIKAKAEEQPTQLEKDGTKGDRYVKAQSKAIAQETQAIFEKEGPTTKGANLAMEKNKPFIHKVANTKWNPAVAASEQAYTKADFVSDLQMEYRRLYESFDPKKNTSISAYINKYLPLRANRLISQNTGDFNKGLGQQDDEGGGNRGIAQEEAYNPNEEFEATDMSFGKTKQAIADFGFSGETMNEIETAASKVLGGKLPDPSSRKFNEAVKKDMKTATSEIVHKALGSRKDYDNFVDNNWQAIAKALPQKMIEQLGEGTIREGGEQAQQAVKNWLFANPKQKKKRKRALADYIGEYLGGNMAQDLLQNNTEAGQRFRAIQEMQGNANPENAIEKAIDALQVYKGDQDVRHSLRPEEAAKVDGLKAVAAGLKQGMSPALALEQGFSKVSDNMTEAQWSNYVVNQMNQHTIQKAGAQEGLQYDQMDPGTVEKTWERILGKKMGKQKRLIVQVRQNKTPDAEFQKQLDERFKKNREFFEKHLDKYLEFLPKGFWDMYNVYYKDGSFNRAQSALDEETVAEFKAKSKVDDGLHWTGKDPFGAVDRVKSAIKLQELAKDPKVNAEVDMNQQTLFSFGEAIQNLAKAGVPTEDLIVLTRTHINSGLNNGHANIFRRAARPMGYSGEIEGKTVPEHNPPAGSIAISMMEEALNGTLDQEWKDAVAEKFGYWQINKKYDPAGSFVAQPTAGFNIRTDNPNIRYFASGANLADIFYADGTPVAVAAGFDMNLVQAAQTNSMLGDMMTQAMIEDNATEDYKQQLAKKIDNVVKNSDNAQLNTAADLYEATVTPSLQGDLDSLRSFIEDPKAALEQASLKKDNLLQTFKDLWPEAQIITDKQEAINLAQRMLGMTEAEAKNYIAGTNGFAVNAGKNGIGSWIFLSPDNAFTEIMNTAVHELGHVWSKALSKKDPGLFTDGIKKLMKAGTYWGEQVQRLTELYPHLVTPEVEAFLNAAADGHINGDYKAANRLIDTMRLQMQKANRHGESLSDVPLWDFIDEMLAGAIGDRGELKAVFSNDFDRGAWQTFIDNVVASIKRMFNMGSNIVDGEQFLDMALGDILQGSKADTVLAQHYAELSSKPLRQKSIELMNEWAKGALDADITIKESLKPPSSWGKRVGAEFQFEEDIVGKRTGAEFQFRPGMTLDEQFDLIKKGWINAETKESRRPVKRLSAFDFDDTLFKTHSKVVIEGPNGSREITAAEFAKGPQLAEGESFNFEQFDQVVKPEALKGLQTLKDALQRGDDVVVLTARTMKAGGPVMELLQKVIGPQAKKIKFKGVAHSSPQAKVNYIQNSIKKYGYNNIYFTDDAIKNTDAMKVALDAIPDINARVDVAHAIGMEQTAFEDIPLQMLADKKGKSIKTPGSHKAQILGRKKDKWKFSFFLPRNAEDFQGLLYELLPSGKKGDAAMKFFKENLFEPFAKAESDLIAIKNRTAERIGALNKAYAKMGMDQAFMDSKIPGQKVFSMQDAIRAYLMTNGFENDLDGLSKNDLQLMKDVMESNRNMIAYADTFKKRLGGYPETKTFEAGTLGTDVLLHTRKNTRPEVFAKWRENVDTIFSKRNLDAMEAELGSSWRKNVEQTLARMKSGRNRRPSDSKATEAFTNWINGSTAIIMAVNLRSAALQLLSTVNFIGMPGNNVWQAGKAFMNQKQYWKDVSMLWNSPYLLDRRDGSRFDLAADEIANEASYDNKLMRIHKAIAKKGFIPTQLADSLAIALGGASWYRNQMNQKPEDVSEAEWAEKVMNDFTIVAEEAQQSSRTDRISNIQASPLGRLIFAFGNTPLQYARLTKRAVQDLANNRGNRSANMRKLAWYGAVQGAMFAALQNGLIFALMGDDEEDDRQAKKQKEKDLKSNISYAVNSFIDSFMRGWGLPGAVATAAKGVLQEAKKQFDSGRLNAERIALAATNISPVISSKLRDIAKAFRPWGWRQEKKKMEQLPWWHRENPMVPSVATGVGTVFNLPLDNAVGLINQGRDAADEFSNDMMDAFALMMGWNKRQLGIVDTREDQRQLRVDMRNGRAENREDERADRKDRREKARAERERRRRIRRGNASTWDYIQEYSPFKKLSDGEDGQAHKDGTIEVDPNLPEDEKKKTIAHEKKHIKQMEEDGLDYNDKEVTFKGKSYERKNGKIKDQHGKFVEEGAKHLPWEKEAYAAEKGATKKSLKDLYK